MISLYEKIRVMIGYLPNNINIHFTDMKSYLLYILLLKNIRNRSAGTISEISSLGIPSLELSDGPCGINNNEKVFAYPSPILLASSWNRSVLFLGGQYLGQDACRYKKDVVLSPGINLIRNPLAGRNFEMYSEDPLLSGILGSCTINGIQSMGIGSCIKHFAAYNQEQDRTSIDIRVSKRALYELYLRVFSIALSYSDPLCLMTSYNKVNGFYTSEHSFLIQECLRKKMKYKGVIMTDWVSGSDPVLQIKAGINLIMPGGGIDLINKLIKIASSDSLVMNRVNESLSYIIRFHQQLQELKSKSVVISNHNKKDLSDESIILLQNKNHLPIRDNRVSLFEISDIDPSTFVIMGGGSSEVTPNQKIDLYEACLYRRLDAIRIKRENISETTIQWASEKSSTAIITISRYSTEFKDIPVSLFDLSSNEIKHLKMISRIFHSKHKKITVVLNIPGPIETQSWKHLVDSILLCYYPGSIGSVSVIDILLGNITPSGKLTCTFPNKLKDHPSTQYYLNLNKISKTNMNIYTEDIYVGYRYYLTYDIPVSFSFGHGLSYTTFKYTNVRYISIENYYIVYIDITNIGDCKGKEIVQLYISYPASIGVPKRELKSFEKTNLLDPYETEQVKLVLRYEDLLIYHPILSEWTMLKGEYRFELGASSDDIRTICKVNIE
jgi:beta-glucosidase